MDRDGGIVVNNEKIYEIQYCPVCGKEVFKHRVACCWCGIDIQQADEYYNKYATNYKGMKYDTFKIIDVPPSVKATNYHSDEIHYAHFRQYLIILIPLCLLFSLTQGGLLVVACIILFVIFGLSKEKEYNQYYMDGDNSKRGLINNLLDRDAQVGDQNDSMVLESRKRRELKEILVPLSDRVKGWHHTFAVYGDFDNWSERTSYYDIPSISDMSILKPNIWSNKKMIYDYSIKKDRPLEEKDFIQLQKDRIIAKKIKSRLTEQEWKAIGQGIPSYTESMVTLPHVCMQNYAYIALTSNAYNEAMTEQTELKGFTVMKILGVTGDSFYNVEKLFDIEWGDEIL